MRRFIIIFLFTFYTLDISAIDNKIIKTKGPFKGTKSIFKETKSGAIEDYQILKSNSNRPENFPTIRYRRLKETSIQNKLYQNYRNLDSSIIRLIEKEKITHSVSMENIRDLKNDKYDTAKEIWAVQYGSKGVASYDAIFKAVLDQYGNIYVRENYHTVKYDSNGNEIWRIKTTGWRSAEHLDIDTLRKRILLKVDDGIATYNYDGVRIWFHKWSDNVDQLKFCKSGDIYIVGEESKQEYYIQKFSSNGVGLWWDVFEAGDFTYVSSVAFDNARNIFIGYHYDFIRIIKYSPDGELLWQRSYSGPGEGENFSSDLVVGQDGSVYITGLITNTDGWFQMVTIKYSRYGGRIWVKKYINPYLYNYESEGISIRIDKSGNILVLGGIRDYKNYPEIKRYSLLIKYTSAGDILWEKTFVDVVPWNMTLDNFNNIYVTGQFMYQKSFPGFVTIKYNTNGHQQWVKYYSISNLDSSSEFVHSEPYNIISVGKRNLIVVGTMIDGINKYNFNTAIVNYDTDGVKKWARHYDSPWISNDHLYAIDVDAQGNMYLTGTTYNYNTGYDILTVKFNNKGELEWADKHTSIDDYYSGDVGDDIYVDKNNNVYVTGFCSPTWNRNVYLTIKYNTYGVKQWVATHEIPYAHHDLKIVGDKEGNIYVGYGDLVKYDTLGNKLWSVPIGGGQIILDDFGAIIVTGRWGTKKFSSEGILLWSSTYGGEQIAVDQIGNIYLTRHTMDEKYNTMKLNSSGVLQWSVFYSRMPNGIGRPSHIAIDKHFNVYVTGYSRATGTALDFTTIKYDSSGVEQWVQYYQGGGVPRKIVIDSVGNIYVSGSNYLTLKYNQAGTLIWVAHYRPSQSLYNYVQDVDIDIKGNVYVAGKIYKKLNDYEILYSAVKYSPAQLEFSDNFIDFGVVSLSCKSSKTLHIKNIGSEKLIISDIEIEDSNFTISPNTATLLPFDSITCNLTFNPIEGGMFSTNCNFLGSSQTLINTLNISGLAVPTAPLNFSKTVIQFSLLEVGCKDTADVKLFNNNSCPDTVIPVFPNNIFTVIPSKLIIRQYDSVEFKIIFTPSHPGEFNSYLTFNSLRGTQSDSIIITGSSYATRQTTTITSILNKGWNLISLPVESSCPYVFSNLFKYTNNGYIKYNILEPGLGFWLKSYGEELNFYGYPISCDTFELQEGWNLIGSISYPVHISSIITNPPNIISSHFYAYQSGYRICDSIYPSQGYWLKSNSPGTLILSINNPLQNEKITTFKKEIRDFNSFTFTDINEHIQTLYFGIKPSDDFSADIYELPPVPPSDVFDVRYASQKMLEVVENNKFGEFPIQISSAEYPVTISWKMNDNLITAHLKLDNRKIILRGEGKVTISNPESRISLKINGTPDLPKEFALEQNYPNPFNPVTNIKYQLPVISNVELKIYNIMGQEVKTLVDEVQDAGYYEIVWNGDNNAGNPIASGVYFYRMQAGSFVETRKLVLIR